MSSAADGPRSILKPLHGYLSRRELLEDALDAFLLVAAHERFLELLEVDGRGIVGVYFSKLVSRQDVKKKIALLEPMNPLSQELASRRLRILVFMVCERCIKYPARIFWLIEVITQAVLILLRKEVEALLCGINLRGQLLEV